ncbi:MAG TPA: hypothetical protein VGU70_19640 [Methylobacterium sp.]|jgi:hypothetical protein|uniref:hypothetical protein n=1 Tax=Methylorubrum sp. B1-46 TaxID=2897334 RepID=UPI001E30636B|nr:hypothetical protein [Methylorubrum sp. B1-46]UGB24252.1 hypothetical protein LPC10_14900 [Methylorubrum sp. B1-46]HEV2544970.1 hypothetical protein [Methylobacterium sp.]
MTNTALELFCTRIVDAGRLTQDDVRELAREILPDGIMGREEADLLLALDRAVADIHEGFAAFVTAEVVNFAVYGERPTGIITREMSAWLSASIAGRKGPTALGSRIAMEIVREAETSDETLIAFALKAKSALAKIAAASTAECRTGGLSCAA